MQLARPKPVPPRKGRPAALGASPSQIAKQYERGVKAQSASGGVSFQPACRAGGASLGSALWARATDIRMPSASPSVTMAVPP